MKRVVLFPLFAFLLLAAAEPAWAITEPDKKTSVFTSHFENVLGTSLQIKVKTPSEKQAAAAEAVALHEIERLSAILSAYDKQSEFSRWMQTSGKPITISRELFEVLDLFDQWRSKTNGALDASAQVISNVWKEAAARQTLPSAETIQKALQQVQASHWQLDAVHQTATHTSNVPLVLNSFAKSYIIHRATEAAREVKDVEAVMVNIGGDIVVQGDLSETIHISNPKADAENDLPLQTLLVNNRAVATSGNYRRGEYINGQWYSHIVDPRTGMPVGEVISATVVSPNAADAGALATAFNVLTPDESAALAATIPGTEFLLVTKAGHQIKSKGWDALTVPEPIPISSKPAANQWDDNFELVINIELAQLPGFARRPFAAVWVVDEDNKPIRTIAVWYNKDRWLHELRAWFSTNRASFSGDAGSMSTISSATRSAGKYALKWDGKDDKGNYVKPGKYTINIEVVREHGTYQLMNGEINCAKKAQLVSLTGNAEVAGASLEYRKKTVN
jgi:thiamine biosynthesis lipoprotein